VLIEQSTQHIKATSTVTVTGPLCRK